MLGVQFRHRIGVDGDQVVLILHLHAVTGKKEYADILVRQVLSKIPQCLVHVLVGAIRQGGDGEATIDKLVGDVVGVIDGIL